ATSSVLEERAYHVLGSAHMTGRSGADLDEVPPHRVLMVHRVEGDDTLHIRRSELEDFGHLRHALLAHPATILLHDPERGQERCHLRGIATEKLLELRAPITDEDRSVRLVRGGHVRRG